MTWHIKRDYDFLLFLPSLLFSSLFSMTWHIKRDYDSPPFPSSSLLLSLFSMTWHIKRDYDFSHFFFLPPSPLLLFSMTWHIKRDYDKRGGEEEKEREEDSLWPDISKGITTLLFFSLLSFLPYSLWPDISKGITTPLKLIRRKWRPRKIFSMTWHIKRDYDTWRSSWRVATWRILYDLTYQKGLRLMVFSPGYFVVMKFSMTWHIKRDYDICMQRGKQKSSSMILYDLTYQKGLRLQRKGNYFWSQTQILYDLTYQKGLRQTYPAQHEQAGK